MESHISGIVPALSCALCRRLPFVYTVGFEVWDSHVAPPAGLSDSLLLRHLVSFMIIFERQELETERDIVGFHIDIIFDLHALTLCGYFVCVSNRR